MPNTTSLKVALDWTPNTIHTGLYIALTHGLYAAENLNVQLLPPDATYASTPAKRLEAGEVDLAICPSESCIAYAESGKMQLQAIYAILQKDASAIVSTKVQSIAALGNERLVYGSYNARYEDHIVRAMVVNGGGEGESMQIKTSAGKLDLFAELRQGDVDATWVFLPWEGTEAEMEGEQLHIFKTEDYGVPYGYSPVIARNASSDKLSKDALEGFVRATRRGYEIACESPSEAASVLGELCSPPRSKEFLEKSQRSINGYYGGEAALGHMQAQKWETWVDWLKKQGLLKKEDVKVEELFTNDYSTVV